MGNCLDSPVKSLTPSTTRPSSLGTSTARAGSTFTTKLSRNFKSDKVLGEGGFGTVYKEWLNEKTLTPTKSGIGIIVAVKKMKSESMQGLAEWQVDALKVSIENFYGENPLQSEYISRVVNSNHFARLSSLLDDEKVSGKIIHGGKKDEKLLKIAPTLLLDVPDDSLIMHEEIFGPLLPIITFANPNLPFRGVGESGLGSYHGNFSFDSFSHKKAVLHNSFGGEVSARYPPYTPHKQKLLRALLTGDIIGLILALFGWPRS